MTTNPTYEPARTGLLLVDPYNDFLSDGGKVWPRVKEVAERLDITPAFASSLVKALVEQGYVVRERDKSDNRVIWVKVTKTGRALLHMIDEQVQIHVDYFTASLDPKQTEAALSVLMFYVGVSIQQG